MTTRDPIELRFTVPGPPRAWKRAGQRGRRKYDLNAPAKQDIATHAMVAAAKLRERWPTDARYLVSMTLRYSSRPIRTDVDNAIKLVLDALNRVAWADDCQVDGLHVLRVWGSSEPATSVRVTPMEEQGT